MSPWITIFDRHLMRRLLTGYVVLIGALIVFFIVLHYVEFVDDFMDRGATMTDVFTVYYPNYIPEIVRLISPLALFLACVHLTGRLAQKMELAALQTSGVSLYRLMRPYLTVALLVTGFIFWFNGWIVPEANRVRIAFERQYTKDAPRQAEYNNIHRQNRPGSVVTVSFFERSSQTAHSVSLEQFDDAKRLVQRIDAPRMEWIDSTKSWRLRTPVIRRFDLDGTEQRSQLAVLDTVLTLQPRDMARTDGDVDAMTINEAANYIDTLRRSGANNLGPALVAFHGKFSYPFANLILVLLAVPLAAVRRRGGQAMVIGLGLLAAFAYLAAMKLLEPFGYEGIISPVVTAWAPHILFLGVAAVALWNARK